MLRTPLSALVALLVFAAAPAHAVTIEQAMADPDWIGPPVQHPYWSVDGKSLYYSLKQKGTQVRDLHRVGIHEPVEPWPCRRCESTCPARSSTGW